MLNNLAVSPLGLGISLSSVRQSARTVSCTAALSVGDLRFDILYHIRRKKSIVLQKRKHFCEFTQGYFAYLLRSRRIDGTGDGSAPHVPRHMRHPCVACQLFFPIPNILRRMPLNSGGDFTTTIFIAGTPFGMVCCQYMQAAENCHGGQRYKKEGHRASDVLLKKTHRAVYRAFRNPACGKAVPYPSLYCFQRPRYANIDAFSGRPANHVGICFGFLSSIVGFNARYHVLSRKKKQVQVITCLPLRRNRSPESACRRSSRQHRQTHRHRRW